MTSNRSLFENQDYNKIRKECLKNNEVFFDESFNHDVPGAIWLRPGEIVQDPQFFVAGASRFDAVQGAGGDCWLVAAMASLTLNPTLFRHVVPKDQSFSENYAGIFRFNIWQCGEWVEVVIDDRLPTEEGLGGARELMFTHSKEKNEFWSALLEKAYAKLYGSYKELKGGRFTEAMVDFTGGISEFVHVSSSSSDKLETIIDKSLAKGSFLSVCICLHHGIKIPNGLVTKHVYGLTRIITVYPYGRKVCLLQLRNPWGETEWKGPWSDKSPHWQSLPREEKYKLVVVNETDGEFWMPIDEFISNFNYLEICHLSPHLFDNFEGKNEIGWESHAFKGQWTKGLNAGGKKIDSFHMNPQYTIVLQGKNDDSVCSVLIGVLQKNKSRKILHKIGFRVFQLEGQEKESKEPLSQKYITDNFHKSFSCKFRRRRENVYRYMWKPGKYCIMPSKDKPGLEGQYLLRIFTEKKATVEEHGPGVIGGESIYSVDSQRPHKNSRAQSRMLLQRNDQEIKDYFFKIAGNDDEIGWKELQSILEYAMEQSSDKVSMGFLETIIAWIINLIEFVLGINLFTEEKCRSLINVLDDDRSGRLSFKEFQKLWKNLQHWDFVFRSHSRWSTMDKSELWLALREAGWSVKTSDHSRLERKYASKDGKLEFEDYVMCLIDLMTERS